MKKVESISFFMIIIIALVISYHIYYKYDINVNLEEDNSVSKEKISTINVEKNNDEEGKKIIGILEIDKIKLKRNFYDINSKENNVDKNVTVLKGSSMPDIKYSSLFLAAHSGNSSVSYFKKLNMLEMDDQIIIQYGNTKYYYSVSDIYEIDKNGYIDVNKNIHENILVLTTCSKNDRKQLIVKAKLINSI